MSSFKTSDFNIKSESELRPTTVKVTEFDRSPKPVIKNFELNELKRPGTGNYKATQAKFGSMAATDAHKAAKITKDSRFDLNPMMKQALSIEEEENRVIEERVHDQVGGLVEKIKAEAIAKGYEQGWKQGLEEGAKKMQLEADSTLKGLSQLVTEFEGAKAEIFRLNEKFLIDLIFKIARMVLLKELEHDSDYIVRLARECVASLNVKENIVIKISLEDEKLITTLKGNLEKVFGELHHIQVQSSGQVQKGGCQIETELLAIDADLDTQLQIIYESLVGKKSGGGA